MSLGVGGMVQTEGFVFALKDRRFTLTSSKKRPRFNRSCGCEVDFLARRRSRDETFLLEVQGVAQANMVGAAYGK